MRVFAFGLAIASVLAPPAVAKPVAALMEGGAVVAAPPGYLAMCVREARLCRRPAEEPAVMTERQRMKLIRQVNRRVNGGARQRADAGERWQRVLDDGHGVGDCEDYAIQKYAMLIAAGFPPSDLFYAIGYLPGAGLHTVLMARTAKGDLVLDSRTPWTSVWARTPYVWFARQSASDPMVWNSAQPSSA